MECHKFLLTFISMQIFDLQKCVFKNELKKKNPITNFNWIEMNKNSSSKVNK